MKSCNLLLFVLIWNQTTFAQKGSSELMAGHRYLHYSHTLAQLTTPQSRLGWLHNATLIKQYRPDKDKRGHADELMNQIHLTYQLYRQISLKAGLFYTNTGGYKPSLGLQWLFTHKRGSIVLSPRADISKKQAYEFFIVSEYYLQGKRSTRWIIRFQAMSNTGPRKHNRSYQLIRLGVDARNLQYGAGLTLDEYGNSNRVYSNAGLFIRKRW